MIADTIQRALLWLLTWEVVGILAGVLVSIGIPAQVAPILVIGIALFVIWKAMSDRYMVVRWKRKYYRWRG